MTKQNYLKPAPPIGTAIRSWREDIDFIAQYEAWIESHATAGNYLFQDYEGVRWQSYNCLLVAREELFYSKYEIKDATLFVSDYELKEGFVVVPFGEVIKELKMFEKLELKPAPPIGTIITSWREWTDFLNQYGEWLDSQIDAEGYSFQDWEGNKLGNIHDLRSPSDILFVSAYELKEGFKVVPFLKQQPKRPAPKQCVIKNSFEGFLLKTQFRDWCCDHKQVLDSFYQLGSKGQKEKVDVDYNSGFPWVVVKTAERFKDKYETVSAFEPISLVEDTEVIFKLEEALQEKEKLEIAIKDVETSVFNFLNGLE